MLDRLADIAKRYAPEALLLVFLLALVFIGFRFRGSLKATDTTTPRPTLGYTITLPGARFPDNAAFLAAGQHIDLLVYTGGPKALLTAPAVVVAVATGTITAVQVDLARPAAETLQGLLLEEKLMLQYLPATATATADATATAAADATGTVAAAATGTAAAEVPATPMSTPDAP